MDAVARRTKEAELDTWQRNLATLQGQAANYGMSPPLDLVNEIETAKRNVKRVQMELDAGQEQSAEATLMGILELTLSIKRQTDEHSGRLAGVERQLVSLHKRANPNAYAQTSRIVSALIVFGLYTAAVIKEARDTILANLVSAAVIIALALALAILLRVLANLLQPIEVRDDDH